MRNISSAFIIVISITLLFFIFSCASKKPILYKEGQPLLITNYEKIAQKEFDADRFDNAIEAYQAIIDNYSDNTKALVWAHYEIGFCYYMKKEFEQSRKYFRIVINEYREPAATTLAEQMLDRIEELEAKKMRRKKKEK